MRVPGLSFSGHGASACLVEDGHVVSAVNLVRVLVGVRSASRQRTRRGMHAERAVRAVGVVLVAPVGDNDLGFQERVELFDREQLVAHA
jgi:hypothetical protein